MAGAEAERLEQDARRERNWKRWGPYLAERQWGTVREDYSADGNVWEYFSHDQSRSRAYRWGEDGLLGITDRQGRLCFGLALWNGRDPILKERLFGLTGPEGNHGEDVKELYYYLDATPTHSYLKGLYKYPQAAFPYDTLVQVNRERGKLEPEYELLDTGVFDGNRYFDVTAEYAKADEDDILVRITVANRGPEAATLHLLPTVWFRNTWSWGRDGEGYWPRPTLRAEGGAAFAAEHMGLGRYRVEAEPADGAVPHLLFTENETNLARLYGAPNPQPYVKDAFHQAVVGGDVAAVNPDRVGTKAAFHYRLIVPAGGERIARLRLREAGRASGQAFGPEFERVFATRVDEADAFYGERVPASATEDERRVLRQGYAGLLWSKQFYHYVQQHWIEGDPAQPAPPAGRLEGRNAEWPHVYNRDIISMPDKWEYPWFAAWDLAFHMIPFAKVDPHFAKEQLLLLLREWYMHPNGQIPAYEFAFGDVNPPVHAWACWRVYKMTGPKGQRDRLFLERVFQKLLLNFTWWVNRKDPEGRNLFSGGFLGLDNIGVFDRSRPLPTGGHLEQADGTAWMAFYCNTMLSMALELASEDPAYEDLASKFFEHFIAIADAINNLGGSGLWCDDDGFYYDQLHVGGEHKALRIRSLVGIMPLIAAEVLDEAKFERLKGFRKRMSWFLTNRPDLARHIACMEPRMGEDNCPRRLLAIPTRERLQRVLRYVLDETEFLSPHGIRSVSRVHKDHPYEIDVHGEIHRVDYVPAEGNSGLFGGNSNWRGPIWFPINFLVLEALERYHHFYGDDLKVECPVGSGRLLNLQQVAQELQERLARIFLADAAGQRPCHGDESRYAQDPHWKDLVLFHEYFHGDSGRGVGASHQTGWTALVLKCIEDTARRRGEVAAAPKAMPTRRLAGSRR
jgi:hypothetical protein